MLNQEQLRQLQKQSHVFTVPEWADLFKVSKPVIYRALAKIKDEEVARIYNLNNMIMRFCK